MDAETLEALRPKLVAYFRHRAGDGAEDLVAGALAKLALQIAAGDGVRITPPYVWRACSNAAIDAARRVVTRHESAEPLEDVHAARADAPDEGFAESTGRALAALTDAQREAVVLAAEGYSNAEIGQRTGRSANTVAHTLHRAHEAARKHRAVVRAAARVVVPAVVVLSFAAKMLAAEREEARQDARWARLAKLLE